MVGLSGTLEDATKEEANRLDINKVNEIGIVKSNRKTYVFSFEHGNKPLEEFLKYLIYK